MRDPVDSFTLELIEPVPAPAKRGRGRPRKPDALSAADRARRYRQRRAQKPGTLAFSVLCELTMSHLKFPPVTA